MWYEHIANALSKWPIGVYCGRLNRHARQTLGDILIYVQVDDVGRRLDVQRDTLRSLQEEIPGDLLVCHTSSVRVGCKTSTFKSSWQTRTCIFLGGLAL